MTPRFMVPIQYFTPSEMECKCGCGVSALHPTTLKKLDLMRIYLGYSIGVNSACRCAIHNRSVGGSPKSSHIATENLHSYAIDLRCKNSEMRMEMVEAAIRFGFHRIGIYENFIHVDDDPSKPKVMWYGK
jgi:hypothetical protein